MEGDAQGLTQGQPLILLCTQSPMAGRQPSPNSGREDINKWLHH